VAAANYREIYNNKGSFGDRSCQQLAPAKD